MIDRYRSELTVGVLVFVLGVVAVGTFALSGSAVAQSSSSVDLEDMIYTDQDSFEVSYDTDPGCIAINKNGEQQEVYQVEGTGSVTVSVDDVDGITSGDEITAELVLADEEGFCTIDADTDSTTVTQAGTVELDDQIYADQSEFDVSVTELRLDGGRTRGCVIVSNSRGSSTELTMQEGETRTVTEGDVGSFGNRDRISARLTDDGKCGEGEELDGGRSPRARR